MSGALMLGCGIVARRDVSVVFRTAGFRNCEVRHRCCREVTVLSRGVHSCGGTVDQCAAK